MPFQVSFGHSESCFCRDFGSLVGIVRDWFVDDIWDRFVYHSADVLPPVLQHLELFGELVGPVLKLVRVDPAIVKLPFEVSQIFKSVCDLMFCGDQ